MESVTFVGLLFDGWTNNAGVAFIGVTGHYIDENWVMRKGYIDLIQLLTINEDANAVRNIIETLENLGHFICHRGRKWSYELTQIHELRSHLQEYMNERQNMLMFYALMACRDLPT